MPFTLGTDPRGNSFLHFQLPPLAPFGQKEIRVTARLLMFPDPGRTDFRPPPNPSLPPVAPEIAALAQQVAARGEGDVTKRLFDWVTANIRYGGASGRDRGALHALKSGEGDCTDMALLFSALCRAQGIPSRTVGGFVCERNTNLSAASYHNWAEFFRHGRWWIADPSQKRFQPDGAAYVAFHIEEEGEGARYQRFKIEGDQLRARMQ
ncbi:MAG: transglutaminase domain-containing protein [Deltaproteobacteria bacterium]|nr:transglutaminase domain-containing protein [Deltaproteobacteria bacterium]